ncbi:Major facilitator superfamily domain, general substrate transporter [Penicillium griseofulvum]|uniref:Major facilitator superfamily domain, general substrate transporter n=1 Tax=Penicillium patulum TaxID=5078 RepID=A0A135M0B2_PENPA|nr:Major facilitator superfamily domain, general substrate transporter [Penicillium griseofulvum]KXG54659.1 Major facilitator superfamily domain, general substrate transporter [Penicillium griseofulvum]
MNRQREAEKALHDQTNILPFAQLMVVFTGLAISLLICMVDQNGISVTLPTISRELGAQNTISWAGTSSLIANTMFTVLYGRLSDIFGRKIMYISALILLCIADLLCGLSQNPAMFYVFRGLAGVAGGGVTSLTMIIVSDIVTLEKRGKYQGILGASLGLGNIIGPFLGAAFIMRSTWRGFFWLISPLAACSAVVGYFLIPNNARKDSFRENIGRIDWFGLLASSVGIIFLLIPISGGGSYFPWDSPMVISMLVIGGCSLVAFLLIEWKVATLPMLPVAFFNNKVISAIFLQSFLYGAVYQASLYYLPLYYQNARGWSPITSAAMTCPMVAAQSIFSITSGLYISRLKRYGEIIWIGFGLWTLGSGLMLLFGTHTHPAVIAVIVAVMGAGIGFTFQPTLVALQAHCTKSQRAVVIANRNFFRCIGGSCGLAISAAILQATLRSNLPTKFAYLAESSYSLPSRANLSTDEWASILLSYSKASHAVFILQVPLIGVCFLACMFVRDRGLERPKEPEEIEEEKRKAQEERDTEAATSEYPEEFVDPQTHHQAEKRHSVSTIAESWMPPSRPEPNTEGHGEEKQQQHRGM